MTTDGPMLHTEIDLVIRSLEMMHAQSAQHANLPPTAQTGPGWPDTIKAWRNDAELAADMLESLREAETITITLETLEERRRPAGDSHRDYDPHEDGDDDIQF